MDSKLSLHSLSESEVFSPCSIEHQDVFMYDDERRGEMETESLTYLDISTNKSSQFPGIKKEIDQDTLMSWTQKHPEHWTQNEILDWIYFVASTIDVDPTTIRGEGFQNITGPELCRMSLADFQKRDPVNGKCFFDMFKSLHKDAFFIEPMACDFNPVQERQYTNISYPSIKEEDRLSCAHQQQLQTLENAKLSDNIVAVNEKEMQVRLGEYWYPIDCLSLDDMVNKNWPVDVGYTSSDSDSISETSDRDSPAINYGFCQRTGSVGSDVMSDDDYDYSVTAVPTAVEGLKNNLSSKKKKPSQRKTQQNADPEKQQNRGRKPGQISKGNHLWEFIRDLLKDSKFNPHLLRWEEKETGVFRFVQSEAVAQMWGRKKNNPGMTYEKLSRAMRYYYKRGILDRVDGRRLVYKFGVNSHGWK